MKIYKLVAYIETYDTVMNEYETIDKIEEVLSESLTEDGIREAVDKARDIGTFICEKCEEEISDPFCPVCDAKPREDGILDEEKVLSFCDYCGDEYSSPADAKVCPCKGGLTHP